MRFFGTNVVILLVLIVEDAISHCPERGCECGEFCVNINNRWCNNNNDKDCSCVKGCLVLDRLMKPGDNETIYCGNCRCSRLVQNGEAVCTGESPCPPDNLILNVDYPDFGNESPNCHSSAEDYTYEDITPGIILDYLRLCDVMLCDV
ncbi:hypothetical protein ACJMK2_022694 [Sinanodonta woodiana]|uniref:Uncharacterized protein n=1 Tax=Sinanodonta woodiana TaxID=1069815 RepID=A0ABD3TJW5_SINWO